MEKILVSACLVGDNTRYDGKNSLNNEVLEFTKTFDFILVCPEVMGGLPTPRPKSEIVKDKVFNENNKDVTKYYIAGIDKLMSAINFFHIKRAILKEKSPACGVNQIYDGTFHNKLINGNGLLTKKLISMGITVYSENDLDKLKADIEKENAVQIQINKKDSI